MYWFTNSKWAKPKFNLQLQPGETLLFQSAASHFNKWQAVGGELYLTNQRLAFKSHRFNFKKDELTILLSDIAELNRYKTTVFTNNGLMILTKADNTEKFVVNQPAEWLSQLTASRIGLAGA